MDKFGAYECGCINKDGYFSIEYRGKLISKICPHHEIWHCNASCAKFHDPLMFHRNGNKYIVVTNCGEDFYFKKFKDFRFEVTNLHD